MSRYDFGFLTVFWGDNDPQGRKKDPLRPPGGPGQPAARRVNTPPMVRVKIYYCILLCVLSGQEHRGSLKLRRVFQLSFHRFFY